MNDNKVFKYQKTFHLPWSKCVFDDDKLATDFSHLIGEEVVVTEKLDGECTTMYPDYSKQGLHARSVDSPMTWWREWCRNVQINIADSISGYRVCGENMAAVHSIEYDNLVGFFYVFSIWDQETNNCLSWDETTEMAELLDLPTPKVLYRGVWDEKKLRQIFEDMDYDKMEGYTIRTVKGFHYDDFSKHLVKAVRPNHVQTDKHWSVDAKPAKLQDDNVCHPSFMAKKNK